MKTPPIHEEFSLTEGGVFTKLLLRFGSIKSRITILALITWIIPLLLALIQGIILGKNFQIRFITDFTVAIRFLVAIPLLIIAEVIIGSNVVETIRSLKKSEMILKNESKFEYACSRLIRWRDSSFAEIILLVLIAINIFLRLKSETWSQLSDWQTYTSPHGLTHTWAGWWHFLVSVPLYQFILFRWLWRYIIWVRLLWDLSRINLRLVPTHPDCSGGLGLFSIVQESFGIILLSFSAVLSAFVLDKLFIEGTSLSTFQPVISTYIFLGVVIFILPLCFFTPLLIKTRRLGLFNYGDLGDKYSQLFNDKWIEQHQLKEGELLGSPDIQSLSDLSSAFERIEKMKPFPFKAHTVLVLIFSSIFPFLPLVLTQVPVKELLGRIAGMILKA